MRPLDCKGSALGISYFATSSQSRVSLPHSRDRCLRVSLSVIDSGVVVEMRSLPAGAYEEDIFEIANVFITGPLACPSIIRRPFRVVESTL